MRYVVLIVGLCFAATAQAAQSAQNANSIYAGLFGGFTFVPDVTLSQGGASSNLELDPGFNFGAVVGYKWAIGLRAEGEISYRQNDTDNESGIPVSGDMSALAFMGNAWYDFHLGTPWIPYVGGGLGFANVSVDVPAGNDGDVVFAWQFGGGVGYEFSPGVVASVDYRYLATEDPNFSLSTGSIDAEYSSHSIIFGIRGHF